MNEPAEDQANQISAAIEYGELGGYRGVSLAYGGVAGIVSRAGVKVAENWIEFHALNRTAIRDYITRQITGYGDFAELARARGTVRIWCQGNHGWRGRYLADAYDVTQYHAGGSKRAIRL